MDFAQLSSATAIVTGAASGLGAATAERLAKRGLTVFGFDLQEGNNAAVHYERVDVTKPEQVRRAVASAAEAGPLRVVVNCAGICPSQRIVGRAGVHDHELFATTIGINLVGTFSVMAEAAAQMAATEPLDADGQRGVVVNTASVAAFEGQIGQAAYAASKGGVQALGITAARDMASLGIRVMTIAPGIVQTPMMASVSEEYREELEQRVTFPKRMAQPEEYAQLVEQIVANDYLNGETIRLDGALRMPPR